MTDLFVHWVDVAHWYMGADKPSRATATGVKALLQRRQTPDTMSAALSYPASVVEFDSTLLGYIEGGGLTFRGTKGAMRLHRAGYEVYNEIPGYTEGFRMPPVVIKGRSARDGTIDHIQNFLDCVRSRNEPNARVGVGVSAAHAGHVANLALRSDGVWGAGGAAQERAVPRRAPRYCFRACLTASIAGCARWDYGDCHGKERDNVVDGLYAVVEVQPVTPPRQRLAQDQSRSTSATISGLFATAQAFTPAAH